MRHFDFLDPADADRLFHQPPAEVRADDGTRTLAMALGATLYVPATRPDLVKDLLGARASGVVSTVLCLEDAIPDDAVSGAQRNVVEALQELADRADEVPLVFVRVRTPEQIEEIAGALGAAPALVGFVLPKFGVASGTAFLAAARRADEAAGRPFRLMPVVESPEVMHRETRLDTLLGIRDLLMAQREQVLAVRIGATDLASVHGLRRPRDLTVYNVRPVADAIADVVNVLGRLGDEGFTVTGPVWEYFVNTERLFKPQLRETPFSVHRERALRASLVARDLDGLIREVVLDRVNGLVGKTVIHPSHVPVVHALSVVSYEEHVDALDILGSAGSGGGVTRSNFGNKMNEGNPHRSWAELVALRGRVFGVAREDISFVDLLAGTLRL